MVKPAHAPAEFVAADLYAVRAVYEGTANEGQQRRAFEWILRHACGIYDLSYRPGGDEGGRATDFAEGRRFAGLQIAKLLQPEALKAVTKKERPASNSKRGKDEQNS